MTAVVVTRHGDYPLGGMEAVAECGGRAVVIDVDGLHPAALAAAVLDRVRDAEVIVLAASPDGRDLAPRLAALLGRPLMAGAVSAEPGRAIVARRGGLILETHIVDGPYVATLQPGGRGVPAELDETTPDPVVAAEAAGATPAPEDPVVVEVTTPDASELDLAEATRILAVGAGLGEPGFVVLAGRIAEALGMSLGATRVVTDLGWLPFQRQIGTTGAMVDPEVYVALGVSGAVQHVSGLGQPDHIASINIDGSCPMSAMAETNIVCDARGVLVAMADRLGVDVDPTLRGIAERSEMGRGGRDGRDGQRRTAGGAGE